MPHLVSEASRATEVFISGRLEDFEVPCFSGPIMNVLRMLREPVVKMQPIAEELQKDPGLSIQALRLVNSVGFGLSTHVNNVHHAAVLLGRSRLECLVLSVAARAALPAVGIPEFDLELFWKTAALRASIAGGFARRLHPATEIESFTAGLLQDIGVVFLADRMRQAYVRVYNAWLAEESAMLSALETTALGFDHAEMGGRLADAWRLPEFLINAIRHHHRRDETSVEEAVWLAALIKTSESGEDIDLVVDTVVRGGRLGPQDAREIAEQAVSEGDQFFRAWQTS